MEATNEFAAATVQANDAAKGARTASRTGPGSSHTTHPPAGHGPPQRLTDRDDPCAGVFDGVKPKIDAVMDQFEPATDCALAALPAVVNAKAPSDAAVAMPEFNVVAVTPLPTVPEDLEVVEAVIAQPSTEEGAKEMD